MTKSDTRAHSARSFFFSSCSRRRSCASVHWEKSKTQPGCQTRVREEMQRLPLLDALLSKTNPGHTLHPGPTSPLFSAKLGLYLLMEVFVRCAKRFEMSSMA